MKILIADDSQVSRRVLESTLQKWGYDVVTASDGVEAWDILRQEDGPPIAVLDWIMPGLTGPEVCRRVREQGQEPYIYILLLSAKNLKEDLVEGMEAGADDYVIKPFDHHELKVRLRAASRLVKLQAELLDAREALREQATKDALTGLWNRPTILQIFERELARAVREGSSVGVVMIDLDHFKTVNDSFGHAAGDAALRMAAERMQSCIRPYDALGRYGGEEFLMVLPGCDRQEAAVQAERMRQILSSSPMELADARLPLTASFGVTTFTANAGEEYGSPEPLIRMADEALYCAKRLGRNRVELSFRANTVDDAINA